MDKLFIDIMKNLVEIRHCIETKLRQVLTMSLKIQSMIDGPKRRVSIIPRSGPGLQNSSSYVQGVLKDASG